MANLRGSYVRLRDNSVSAMLAAIEIYNKPQFEYRDECFVILLVNSWELFLKALLSKNKQRIYYAKRRNQDYRTFSISDCLQKVRSIFPPDIEYDGVKSNIELLISYRDNSVHFYNITGFGTIIYNLAQASVKNYADLLRSIFQIELSEKISLVLLPLNLGKVPIDPIQFIQNVNAREREYSKAVTEFIRSVRTATVYLQDNSIDTTRLMVTFSIKLESTKNISKADVIVGIDNSNPSSSIVIQQRDPNNMLRQKDILAKLPNEIEGIKINQNTFQAFVWVENIRDKPHLCWKDESGTLTKYSPDIIAMIRKLSGSELQEIRNKYNSRMKPRL